MDSEMMNVPGLRAEAREGTEMQGGKKYEELRAENAALRERVAKLEAVKAMADMLICSWLARDRQYTREDYDAACCDLEVLEANLDKAKEPTS